MTSLPLRSTPNNLADCVFSPAQQNPNHPALLFREQMLTYRQLADAIIQLATRLTAKGLHAGQCVGLLLYNTPGFVISYFALLSLGVIVVPLNTRLTATELEVILEDCEAKALITSEDFQGVVADFSETVTLQTLLYEKSAYAGLELDDFTEMPPPPPWPRRFSPEPLNGLDAISDVATPSDFAPIRCTPETLATLIYTSGTTGRPKGVMLSHRNILADATANIAVIEAVSNDRFITISPLFHVFGQTNILVSSMLAGASLVLIPRFSPRRVLEAIAHYRVTFMAAVPTMYLMMLSHLRERDFDLSSLRVCHSGAAPMAVDTFHTIEAIFGAPVQEGYGLSEASSIVCSNPMHGTRKPGSVGLPLPGIEVVILSDEPIHLTSPQQFPAFREAAVGEIGELYVRGDIVMLGYYRQPELTKQALFPDAHGHIWLKTKDLCYKDADGYIHIVDRTDDLINIGGVKIYPREIEEVLHRHPAVQAVAVTGIPSTLHHEAIKAFVVLHPGERCDRETLQAFCKPNLADFKIPQQFEFVREIPQGATGKILRRELRR